jgi:hypothetical protein
MLYPSTHSIIHHHSPTPTSQQQASISHILISHSPITASISQKISSLVVIMASYRDSKLRLSRKRKGGIEKKKKIFCRLVSGYPSLRGRFIESMPAHHNTRSRKEVVSHT